MLSPMDGNDEVRLKWDGRYAEAADAVALPLEVLAENAHLLPTGGEALDLACGLGGSALFLARRGFRTLAWDISSVAIDALRDAAARLPLTAEVRDLETEPPPPERFDVICVGHFLDRGLCPAIAAALRPGGLLFYQTYTLERTDQGGPSSQRFRLAPNELLSLFPDLIVRVYRDEGVVGDTNKGVRNLAQFVAQRLPR
jgi:SAM-dependent methyltransferase